MTVVVAAVGKMGASLGCFGVKPAALGDGLEVRAEGESSVTPQAETCSTGNCHFPSWRGVGGE